MNSLEPKKLALLRILEILNKYTDANHHLTQSDIIKKLSLEYGIEIERKAIGRNLSLLKEVGYDINTECKGCYLENREFEDAELRMLIDGVLSSKYITASHSKKLIDKLCNLSSVYFRSSIKNVYSVNEWSKTDNQSVFYNIDIINEGINLEKKITFDYNRYEKDKKLHKSSSHTVSPYQLILHNQRYYLMALSEKYEDVSYFRLDRITNMKITKENLVKINTLAGFERGIDYKEIATTKPYMYSDKSERIEMIVDNEVIDAIIDCFGTDININSVGKTQSRVMLKSSIMAMEHYAMQYIDHIEIVKPTYLRERIKEKLLKNLNKYEN